MSSALSGLAQAGRLGAMEAEHFSALRAWHGQQARSLQWHEIETLSGLSVGAVYCFADDADAVPFSIIPHVQMCCDAQEEVEQSNSYYAIQYDPGAIADLDTKWKMSRRDCLESYPSGCLVVKYLPWSVVEEVIVGLHVLLPDSLHAGLLGDKLSNEIVHIFV